MVGYGAQKILTATHERNMERVFANGSAQSPESPDEQISSKHGKRIAFQFTRTRCLWTRIRTSPLDQHFRTDRTPVCE